MQINRYIKSLLDECLVIDNELAMLTIIFTIVTGLFTLTIGTYADNEASARKYKAQTVEQINGCGNNALPTNVTCSNSVSNTKGQENINNMTIVHYSFLPFP